MTERYMFDPTSEMTVQDFVDLFKVFRIEVDQTMYKEAPDNVKRMFKPSIFSNSPSRMLN